MSIREAQNKTVTRRFVELMNAQDVEGALALCSSDLVNHALPPGVSPGIESTRWLFKGQFAAFPDLHITLLDMIAEGDRVVYRAVFEGTHQGPLMGFPPTGKHVKWTCIDLQRLVDGRIVENWIEVDTMGLLQQLGLVPPPSRREGVWP